MSIANPGPSTVWAGSAAGGDIAEPSDGQKASGYTGTPAPVYQFVNWLFRLATQGVQHLLSRGIPEWHASIVYEVGALVQHGGAVYRATGTTTGNEPPDIGNWYPWVETIVAAYAPSVAAANTITPGAGTVTNGQLVRVGSGFQEVSFHWSGTHSGAGVETTTFTFSGDVAFANGPKTVQATWAGGSGAMTEFSVDISAGTLVLSVTAAAGSTQAFNICVKGN